MLKPTIHLNGTSRESLTEAYVEAGSALRDALQALTAAEPNARDYYPQGHGAFEQACLEHLARLRRVREVLDEVEALAQHCAGD